MTTQSHTSESVSATDSNSINHVTSAENQAQGNQEQPQAYAPDLERLASALAVLDPDCDDFTWKFKVLAPIANTAKIFPEYEGDLRKLAIAWSRGDFQDEPSKKWVTPGSNSKSGKQVFNSVWARFFKGTFSGRPSTLGTIYFVAREAGWIPPEEQMASSMEDPE